MALLQESHLGGFSIFETAVNVVGCSRCFAFKVFVDDRSLPGGEFKR